LSLGDIGEITRGTTLVTDALIERLGAKLGLITTAGFRDVLEMGTEQRYGISICSCNSPSRWSLAAAAWKCRSRSRRR
jgi:N-methylhydantoinase A/oxoprolinase/acetone carboxylase beta subunit